MDINEKNIFKPPQSWKSEYKRRLIYGTLGIIMNISSGIIIICLLLQESGKDYSLVIYFIGILFFGTPFFVLIWMFYGYITGKNDWHYKYSCEKRIFQKIDLDIEDMLKNNKYNYFIDEKATKWIKPMGRVFIIKNSLSDLKIRIFYNTSEGASDLMISIKGITDGNYNMAFELQSILSNIIRNAH